MLARGITPGEMMRTLDGTQSGSSSILPKHIFSLNTQEFLHRACAFRSPSRTPSLIICGIGTI
jgi:hypothetical protein